MAIPIPEASSSQASRYLAHRTEKNNTGRSRAEAVTHRLRR